MTLIFFNRFFHPDASATSQMLSDLAFHWAAAGRDDHRATRPAQDPEGYAAEQAGGHFPAARAA